MSQPTTEYIVTIHGQPVIFHDGVWSQARRLYAITRGAMATQFPNEQAALAKAREYRLPASQTAVIPAPECTPTN